MESDKTKWTYEKKLVCFIDVMGVSEQILASKEPNDCSMYLWYLKLFKESAAKEDDGLYIFMFSDCMYIVADKEKIHNMFDFLATLTYALLKDTKLSSKETVYKVRGGMTYGEIAIPDQNLWNGFDIMKPKRGEMLIGPAMVKAYQLENTDAIFPRIIIDQSVIDVLDDTYERLLIQDKKWHYFDFLAYIRQDKKEDIDIVEVASRIDEEIKNAIETGNAALLGKLIWYKQYLGKYMQ